MERLGILFGSKSFREELAAVLSLPTGKRPCDRVLRIDPRARLTSQQLGVNTLLIEGELDMQITYVSETEQEGNLVYHCDSAGWKKATSFRYTLDIPGAMPDMIPDSIIDARAFQVNPNSKGLTVCIQGEVEISTRIYTREALELENHYFLTNWATSSPPSLGDTRKIQV